MPEQTNDTARITRGTLFYDGTCGFCLRGIRRIRKPLATIHVDVAPFANGAKEPEMILKWHDGKILGGADAAIFLAKRFPLLLLPATIAHWPPFIYIVRAAYKRIAKNRHCIGDGACEIDFGEVEEAKPGTGWLITTTLIATAIMAGAIWPLPAWIWMWMIAFAMWLGFKTMCYLKAGGLAEVSPVFYIWPGMDTEGFLYDKEIESRQLPLVPPALFIIAGITFLATIPFIPDPLAKGWAGVAAMLCLLHFGSFDWLAAFRNHQGYKVEPIMREPWISRGLGEFWGTRWNRGFSDWAREFLFRPLTAKFGLKTGTIAGFLASGLAHEIVISLPAGAGFGQPTLYFLIQGTGVLVEKRARLRKRGIARLWMWVVVIIPAPLLFHKPFIETVFNPMTQLITNLWTH
ncbi:MAG: DCC1-like thiol-disulfide oxidoreductase family protein [Verrucomicrobiales bacterium]|nr:DCC1-like thiol-disulfide oxidoreductase family protein [Verrucomicrobiales bacterium]